MILGCGQPRNGTSMLMRVLKFGGLAVSYSEELDTPERMKKMRNIHGFFEVRKIEDGMTTFKVWHPKIASKYPESKIIFIYRDIDQAHRSWLALGINRQKGVIEKMRKNWFEELEKHEHIKIRYEDMNADPFKECLRIKEFLKNDMDFDAEKAATAVDKSLYINRGAGI